MVVPGMRPTPSLVREALFSILGHAVPNRPFIDLFAGTGINGLEAISRGASHATFVERDNRLADAIERYAKTFKVFERATVVRGDVYRWISRWRPRGDAVNVYLSPPFADLTERGAEFNQSLATIQLGLPVDSVLTVQLEEGFDLASLPDAPRWDIRTYGRNLLAFWEPEATDPASADDDASNQTLAP
jgi:16S rRNA (guanine(966)-N(2))-methyltransferase RsmD